MRLLRVFPRKTKATPDDALVRFGPPDLLEDAVGLAYAGVEAVHVSVTFTDDKPRAEQLAEQWRHVGLPVSIGGVAYGDRGDEFVPGKYIKPGYVFTSRGCPRRCWFCSVWKRDPVPRLLPIIDGWNILDDNLLACPEDHVRAVFAMLARQPGRVAFTGGLEALALQDYQVELLASLDAAAQHVLGLRPGRRVRDARARGASTPGGRLHRALASPGLLRADRLPGRHVRGGRDAADRDATHRVHPDGHAVAPRRRALAATPAAVDRVATLPTLLGAAAHHSRGPRAARRPAAATSAAPPSADPPRVTPAPG